MPPQLLQHECKMSFCDLDNKQLLNWVLAGYEELLRQRFVL